MFGPSNLEEAKRYHVRVSAETALRAIELLTADDFAEDIGATFALHPEEFSDREKEMAKRLGEIYTFAHSCIKSHECYHVHDAWRSRARETAKKLAARA